MRANDVSVEDYLKFPELRLLDSQRDFVWDSEEIDEFWSDLLGENTFFLGSFILKNDNYNEENKTGYLEIVDGQQRTITILSILSIIARRLHELSKNGNNLYYDNAELQRNSIDQLILYRDRSDLTKIIGSKLRLNDEKAKIFSDALGGEEIPRTREFKQFYSAFKKINEAIDAYLSDSNTDEDKISNLAKLKNRILDIRIILITVTTYEDAYSIFESVNARGVELNAAELINNFLYSTAENKKAISGLWGELKTTLSEIDRKALDITGALRYYWISKYEHVSKKAMFRSIKRYINEGKVTSQKLLEEIAKFSEALSVIYLTGIDDWKSLFPEGRREQRRANEWFSYKSNLSTFSTSIQYLPIYSALFNSINTLPVANRSIIDLLRSIEKINFIYSYISSKPSNKLDQLFSLIGRDMASARETGDLEKFSQAVSSGRSKIEKLLNEMVTREEVDKYIEGLSYKKVKDKAIIKFIFKNIEYVDGGYGRLLFEEDITIEHIYPQSAAEKAVDGWPKKPGFTYSKLGESIGNLTILPEAGPLANGSAGDLPFLDKRNDYYLRSFTSNDYFKDIDSWGKQQIEERLTWIQNRVWDIWGPKL